MDSQQHATGIVTTDPPNQFVTACCHVVEVHGVEVGGIGRRTVESEDDDTEGTEPPHDDDDDDVVVVVISSQ